jgi:hypothetical protein
MRRDATETDSPSKPTAIAPLPTASGRQAPADDDYTDGRRPYEWQSKFPPEALQRINTEAYVLTGMLTITLLGAGVCLGLSDQTLAIAVDGDLKIWISFRLLAIFLVGWVGGVTFSIKWLIHSAAKGKWHSDRRYWRFMVPSLGGVYACVVMTLFGSGIFPANASANPTAIPATAALAFLVGYFSDGVSGLLSNVANAVFGTLEKK